MRLKEPAQRSESEKEQLERMPPGAYEERPVIDERGEEIAPTELDVAEPIPVAIAEVCARDESFVKLAEKISRASNRIATEAAERGQKHVERARIGGVPKIPALAPRQNSPCWTKEAHAEGAIPGIVCESKMVSLPQIPLIEQKTNSAPTPESL